jgi:hypothetical protein
VQSELFHPGSLAGIDGVIGTCEFEAVVGEPEPDLPQRDLAATHGTFQRGFRSLRDNLGAIEVGVVSEQLTQDPLRTLAQLRRVVAIT